METVFLVGPDITTSANSDQTFFTHFATNSNELIGQVADLNPRKMVLFAHGSPDGEMHLFNEEGDESAHPTEIAHRVMATVASKRSRPNLRVLEAYGCSIGAGISTEEAAAASNDPASNVAHYKDFCSRNPDTVCIINAGSSMIFGSDRDVQNSLDEPNIVKLIVSKILSRAETFKVLSGKSGELKSFKFSALRPDSAESLADDALRDFLMTSIFDFTDFYRKNIGALTPRETAFCNDTITEIEKKSPQDLHKLRCQYAKIEAQRGNVRYLRHYLNAGVKADRALLESAVIFGSMETVRFLHEEKGLEINPVLGFGRSPLELAAHNCNFSTASYLCQKKVRLKNSLPKALSSRLNRGRNFLKTVAVLVASGAELENKDREAFETALEKEPNLLPIMLIAARISSLDSEEKSLQLTQLLTALDDRSFLRALPRITDGIEPIKWSRVFKPKFSTEAANFGEILYDSLQNFHSIAAARAKAEIDAESENMVRKLLTDEAAAMHIGGRGVPRVSAGSSAVEVRDATAVGRSGAFHLK